MVNVLLVGIIAVVIVLLILGALDRWNVFGDDRENPESGTDRVKQEARREGDYSVSLLKKHKTLTLPAKVLAISLGLLVLATGVFAYFSLKNGVARGGPLRELPRSRGDRDRRDRWRRHLPREETTPSAGS